MANKNQVNAWLEEFDDDIILSDSDDSVVDPDFIEHLDYTSDHELVSDLENDNDSYNTDDNIDNNVGTSETDFYLGEDNKTKWLKNRFANNNKKRTHNIIITQRPGVNSIAKHAVSMIDCWKFFFPIP